MKDSRTIIGKFLQEKVRKSFGLKESKKEIGKILPDLYHPKGIYTMEVKTSAYNNGGVINMKQLYSIDKQTQDIRFYAFIFHPLTKVEGVYQTEFGLKRALCTKSLFILPFSITKAHFENSKLRRNEKHDSYVQLTESQAFEIFNEDKSVWERLQLSPQSYKMTNLHERVKLITREGNLEEVMINDFNLEHLKIYKDFLN